MLKKLLLILVFSGLIFMTGCKNKKEAEVKKMAENPLLVKFDTPFEVPPFDLIKSEHYLPAFKKGISEHRAEIDSIVNNPAKADFDNTLALLANSGELLDRVSNIFFSETSANMTDTMQKVESEIRPVLSSHRDEILFNKKLYKKIKTVYEDRENLTLNPEQSYLLENTYKQFVRNGADLSAKPAGGKPSL